MEFLRRVDFERLGATSEKVSQQLLGYGSGATSCLVTCTKAPPGEAPPAVAQPYRVDQLLYVLSGAMQIEIAGDTHEAGSGTLVVMPAGAPFRIWNGGGDPCVYLAVICTEPQPTVQMVG